MSARCGLVLRGRPRALVAAQAPPALNDPTDAPAARRAGTIVSVAALSPGLLEVVVALSRPLDHRPGQHVRAAFAGLPARDYVPTLRLDGTCELNELVFLVRRGAGRVASALASGEAGPGDLARVQGPFGESHYRPGPGRLVLASAGAGFAATWAIARAARCLEPGRPLILVAGAREAADLPLAPALEWLAGTGAAHLVVCASGRGHGGGGLRAGRVTAHLPALRRDDVVHAAGPPAMVAAVTALARAAGARCHAAPFTPAPAPTGRTGRAVSR